MNTSATGIFLSMEPLWMANATIIFSQTALVLEGHMLKDMKCDVGWYPAIVSGNGMVIGELYRVDLDDIPAIDMLEGEGDLYDKDL